MLANVVVHFSIRQCVLYTFAGDDLMRCIEISTSGVIDIMLHQARMRTVYTALSLSPESYPLSISFSVLLMINSKHNCVLVVISR